MSTWFSKPSAVRIHSISEKTKNRMLHLWSDIDGVSLHIHCIYVHTPHAHSHTHTKKTKQKNNKKTTNIHTNIQCLNSGEFHFKCSNVRKVPGDDKTTSKLGRGKPEGHFWWFVQLEFCVAPGAHKPFTHYPVMQGALLDKPSELSPKDYVKVAVTVSAHHGHGAPWVDAHVDKHVRMELAEEGVYKLLPLPLGKGWVEPVWTEAVVAGVHVWAGVVSNNTIGNAHLPGVSGRGKDVEVTSAIRSFLDSCCVPLVETWHEAGLVLAKE